MVMYAPGGFASLIMMNYRVAMFGKLRSLALNYLALAVTGLVALIGVAAMIEMTYHLQLSASQGPDIAFMGMQLNTTAFNTWMGAAAVLAIGLVLFEIARRRFALKWEAVQAFIEKQVNKGDAQ